MHQKVLKYVALKKILIDKITKSEYKVDEAIPSEHELMQIYQMSRITVRKAIDDMVNEGYLFRVQGKGTYVKNDENLHDLFSIVSCTEDIMSKGMSVSRKVVSAEISSPEKQITDHLHIQPNDPVFRLERVFFANELPLNYTKAYLPYYLLPGIEATDFSKNSLYSTLETKYEIKIKNAKRTLEAVLADDKIAKHLSVKAGQPLILFQCETMGEIDGEEVTIEFFRCWYRTDMHKFYINQVR